LLNSKCEFRQNCRTHITFNEETWERKERERSEEESEKEEELRLEVFKNEKLVIQEAGKRKRKASCLKKEQVTAVGNVLASDGKKRAVPSLNLGTAQHQHDEQRPLGTYLNEGVTAVDKGLAICGEERAMPRLGQGGGQLQSVQSVEKVKEDVALSAQLWTQDWQLMERRELCQARARRSINIKV
jgi:hypothetical protein